MLLLPFIFSLIFNPLSLLNKLIAPAYLLSWPLMIKVFGREVFVRNAILAITYMFVRTTCKHTSLNILGFDIVSLPLSIASVILFWGTDIGSSLLNSTSDFIDSYIWLAEPSFLVLIEFIIVIKLIIRINKINKWLSVKANQFDDYSSSSDPLAEQQLTPSAVYYRGLIILLTIVSYSLSWTLIQKSESLMQQYDSIPLYENTILAFYSLQAIAIAVTLASESGIVSQPAMKCLLASLSIYAAAYTYNEYMINKSVTTR